MILLVLSFALLLASPMGQSRMASWTAALLSQQLGTTLQVETMIPGWKSLKLTGILLRDEFGDTLLYVRESTVRWASLVPLGKDQRIRSVHLDSAEVHVHPLPLSGPFAGQNNWSRFVQGLPRTPKQKESSTDLQVGQIRIESIEWKVKGYDSLGPWMPGTSSFVRRLAVSRLRLKGSNWSMKSSLDLWVPHSTAPFRLSASIQGNEHKIKAKKTTLSHPQAQFRIPSLTFVLPDSNKAGTWSLAVNSLESKFDSSLLNIFKSGDYSFPNISLQCAQLEVNDQGIRWDTSGLELGNGLTLRSKGHWAFRPGPHSEDELTATLIAGDGWMETYHRLADLALQQGWTQALLPPATTLKPYLPNPEQWSVQARVQQDTARDWFLQWTLNSGPSSLSGEAKSLAGAKEWKGLLRCNELGMALPDTGYLKAQSLAVQWKVDPYSGVSAESRCKKILWNGQEFQNLNSQMQWHHQNLSGRLQIQGQPYHVNTSFQAAFDQNQRLMSLSSAGDLDLTVQAPNKTKQQAAGSCDLVRLCGDFSVRYRQPGAYENSGMESLTFYDDSGMEIATFKDSLSDQPWLSVHLDQGALSCPAQYLPIEALNLQIWGQGESTVCQATLNRDSIHSIGLYQTDQINKSLQQISAFLLGNNDLDNLPIAFSLFARLSELKPYLPFLSGDTSLNATGGRLSLNWTDPNNPSIDIQIDSLEFGSVTTGAFMVETSRFGNSQLVRSEMQKVSLASGSLFDLVSFKQVRNKTKSRIALLATNQSNSDSLKFNGELVTNSADWEITLDTLQYRRAGQKWANQSVCRINKKGSAWAIEDFDLRSALASVEVNGVLSSNPMDKVKVKLNKFNIQQISLLLGNEYRFVEGLVQGTVVGSGLLDQPNLSGNLQVEGLKVDSIELGQLSVLSQFIPASSRLVVQADLRKDQIELAEVKGWIQTNEDDLPCNLETSWNDMPLQLAELFLLPTLDSIRGNTHARIKVTSSLKEPRLKGYLALNSCRFRVPYLKCSYFLDDTLWVDSRSFQFKQGRLKDGLGGRATLNGKISHFLFKDWEYSFNLDSISNLQVLNEPRFVKGDYYYGQGRINGNAILSGNEATAQITVNAQAQRGTKIIVPLDQFSEDQSYEFIRFVDPSDTLILTQQEQDVQKDVSGLDVRFNLGLDPQSEVQLIVNSEQGDQIKGVGNGDLLFTMTKEGDIRLNGDYGFTGGKYSFNMGNLASKNFDILQGSRIVWNGDPFDGQMQLEAVYEIRTSVRNLMGVNQAQSDARNMLKTQTVMNLGGAILKPDVRFEIKLPTINMNDPNDPLVQQVNRINNNEQELNNQVLALLLSGQFIPTENMNSGNLGLSTGASAFNSVTELLTNRLSSLISNTLGGGINLGIDYKGDLGTGIINSSPSNNNSLADSNRRDLTLELNAALFNNRLIIDGNLAVGNSLQVNSQNMAGEVQAEYLINPQGTVRAKAFNRLDDRILNNQSMNYRQGVGFSFNRNFDRLKRVRKKPVSL